MIIKQIKNEKNIKIKIDCFLFTISENYHKMLENYEKDLHNCEELKHKLNNIDELRNSLSKKILIKQIKERAESILQYNDYVIFENILNSETNFNLHMCNDNYNIEITDKFCGNISFIFIEKNEHSIIPSHYYDYKIIIDDVVLDCNINNIVDNHLVIGNCSSLKKLN